MNYHEFLTKDQAEIVEKLMKERDPSLYPSFNRASAVAYVQCFDDNLDNLSLEDFSERYYGFFPTHEEFVDNSILQDSSELSKFGALSYVVVDYEKTYNNLVPYGFVQFGGHYFYNY